MANNCKENYNITESKRLTTEQQLNNLVYIVDTLMSCGLPNMTINIACGIAGNISGESSFNPKAENPSGAYGLCQWMNKRKENLIKFCKENGLDYTEREGQTKFLIHELRNGYKPVYNHVINLNDDIDDIAYTFCMEFEVPGKKYCIQRPGYARECASKYNATKTTV
ncbi:MAG: transglycosylase SLT domain-containing protein [Bacteroidales bacterium]|nr:transglycosylase SLT domain-containing protein [Bacteroidales bacterium]